MSVCAIMSAKFLASVVWWGAVGQGVNTVLIVS